MWVLNIDARRSGAGARFGKAPCLVWAVTGLCALSSLGRCASSRWIERRECGSLFL